MIGLLLPAPVRADSYQDAIQEGNRLYEARKYDKAMAALYKAASAPDASTAATACAYLGLCAYQLGDRDQTITWFQRALEKQPRYLWVLESLSTVYFAARDDYARAMPLAERAEALDSVNPDLYYSMACYHAVADHAAQAFHYLDKAIYFGYTDFDGLSARAELASVRTSEPFKKLLSHLDSITAGGKLLDEAAKKRESGADDEALQLYMDALDRYEEALGPDSVTSTVVLNALGTLSASAGQPDAAITFHEKALAIRTKLLGAAHPDVAQSLNQLGLAHNAKAEYDLAIDCYEKALRIWIAAKGEKSTDVADVYNNLGVASYFLGAYDDAVKFHEEALAIRLAALGPENIEVAQSCVELGVSCASAGHYEKAIGYNEKALAIQVKTLGEESREVAETCNTLGNNYQSNAAYDRAIDYYQRSLAIWTKLLSPGSQQVVRGYANLGSVSNDKGDYNGAIQYLSKALAIESAASAPDQPQVVQCCINLGFSYEHKGEYDQAVGYYERAVAILLKIVGPEHPVLAGTYGNLGNAYQEIGDSGRAIDYLSKSLAIRLKILGPDHPEVALCYNNLGGVYESAGDYDQALSCFQKALAIRLKVLDPMHPDVAQSYLNLAGISLDRKDYDQAVDCNQKALAIWTKILGPEHPQVALAYNNLGGALLARGQLEAAIDAFQKGLALARKLGDREMSILAATNLGYLHLALGEYQESKTALREGIAIIEQARGETGAGKAEFTARNSSLYYDSLQASAGMHDMAGVFEAAESLRARGFLDRLSLSAALSVDGVSDQVRARMLALNDALESLAGQRSAEIRKPEAQQDKPRLLAIVGELQAKEKEFADLDRSLMSNGRYRELRKPTLAGLQDAQAMLKGNEAILEYVIGEQEREPQAWCLVIRASGAQLAKLDESFAYTKAVTDFRNAIINGSTQRDTLGTQLYDTLIAPVDKRLAGADTLIIVPDGALAFLPFDALRKDAKSPYLCERYRTSLAPSVSVLRTVGNRTLGSRTGRWLGLGGARYSGEGAQADRGRRGLTTVKAPADQNRDYYAARGAGAYYGSLGLHWDDLPGTRDEVIAVQKTVYGNAGTRVVTGEKASEQLIKQLSASGELAQQRVLHLACHGLFDAQYPAYSAVVLSEVSGALKGISDEDGYLTVEEVALLKLKADMVNLSACETGLGKVVKGDGLVGLTRAFMVAGANAVGATLWVVDDLATREFMTRVYGLVEKEGISYAEAMARMKRQFISGKVYSDPYFWSPFVLYGR
jgi:tetratricopeptide (TPR) repeat protein